MLEAFERLCTLQKSILCKQNGFWSMQGRIVTHMHLKIVFKWALHFSKLAITRFNSDTKLLQATINTATLQASLLLYASTTAGLPTTTVIHSVIVLYNISHSGSMFYFYDQNVIKFVNTTEISPTMQTLWKFNKTGK